MLRRIDGPICIYMDLSYYNVYSINLESHDAHVACELRSRKTSGYCAYHEAATPPGPIEQLPPSTGLHVQMPPDEMSILPPRLLPNRPKP